MFESEWNENYNYFEISFCHKTTNCRRLEKRAVDYLKKSIIQCHFVRNGGIR